MVGVGGQATLHPGQCVTLDFQVRFIGTESYVDLTNDPNTRYFTVPSQGTLNGNVLCVSAADAGKTFTVYGEYRDPKSGVDTVSTVSVSVVR